MTMVMTDWRFCLCYYQMNHLVVDWKMMLMVNNVHQRCDLFVVVTMILIPSGQVYLRYHGLWSSFLHLLQNEHHYSFFFFFLCFSFLIFVCFVFVLFFKGPIINVTFSATSDQTGDCIFSLMFLWVPTTQYVRIVRAETFEIYLLWTHAVHTYTPVSPIRFT